MKVVGIVQARTSSTRLPGKVLLDGAGKPLILHMLERVSKSNLMDAIWLATSDDKTDDQLAHLIEKSGYNVFRGSLENVLSRFWHIGKMEKADVIVRLTGDCPLHDYQVIDLVIDHFIKNKGQVDYVSNVLPPSYPDGLDTEVFTFSIMDEAYHNSTSPKELEHVVPYIRQKVKENGRYSNFKGPANFSHLRWTLDEPEDYRFIKAVYEALYKEDNYFGWLDVIAWQTKNPERLSINSMHKRNIKTRRR